MTLDSAAFERLADAVAGAIYEEGCFAYYGGDVGMTYWRDLTDAQKAGDLERARELISVALGTPTELLSVCPKCGALVEDLDGFGVLIHDACGYCSHPDCYGGQCRHCGSAQ